MTTKLALAFDELEQREWLQAGLASLNILVLGKQSIEQLTDAIIGYVASYTNCQTGGLFLQNANTGNLELTGRYALAKGREKTSPENPAKAMPANAWPMAKKLEIQNIKNSNMAIPFAAGEVMPTSIYTVPIRFEGDVTGVIELATMTGFSERDKEFIRNIGNLVGVVIHTTKSRIAMQHLLEETQAQSEELQAQHSELETLNEQLETQAARLQASEEELRVQQEELMQSNESLLDKAKMLERQNEMIALRNLDVQRKSDELAQSSKYKSEFLANMSHELRTPLNSILLLSRLLSENKAENLTEQQVEYCHGNAKCRPRTAEPH